MLKMMLLKDVAQQQSLLILSVALLSVTPLNAYDECRYTECRSAMLTAVIMPRVARLGVEVSEKNYWQP
jgi:hypothetical protein